MERRASRRRTAARRCSRPGSRGGTTASSSGGARPGALLRCPAGYENDYGIEPNNSLRQASSHANVDVAVNSKTDFDDEPQLRQSLRTPRRGPRRLGDVRRAVRTSVAVDAPRVAVSIRTFRPKFRSRLYDNADGVNRFTGSATLNNRPTSWFTQRAIVGIDYTGEDARAIERFAPPELAPLLSAATAGGSIGQTLRHNSIITADYSGTAKFDLTSSLGLDVDRRTVLQHGAQSELLSADRLPGSGRRDGELGAIQARQRKRRPSTRPSAPMASSSSRWRDRLFVIGRSPRRQQQRVRRGASSG